MKIWVLYLFVACCPTDPARVPLTHLTEADCIARGEEVKSKASGKTAVIRFECRHEKRSWVKGD